MNRRPTGWRLFALAAAAGLVVAVIPSVASSAARQAKPDRSKSGDEQSRTAFYDSRQDPGSREALSERAAKQGADPAKGVKALRDQLGVQGIVSIDPLTGTARVGPAARRVPHRSEQPRGPHRRAELRARVTRTCSA